MERAGGSLCVYIAGWGLRCRGERVCADAVVYTDEEIMWKTMTSNGLIVRRET